VFFFSFSLHFCCAFISHCLSCTSFALMLQLCFSLCC
jgi:hypothetical protein